MTKTIRDLEATLREWGFSSRRSKAGAAAAWKALTGEDPSELAEAEEVAELKQFAALLARAGD
ncbi:MAG: hypothetical protein E6G92_07190 [Alphaproteobacteria bacterium]|nr:MAG: hypothetical protein E6G92_07190 [Alphaproteobacteria bacterium]